MPTLPGSDRPIPLHVVGAAILDGARCLVAQRGPAMSQSGLWEFPGGKVEAQESPRDALVREVREELGIRIEVGGWLGRGESIAGDREIVLDVYAARRVEGVPFAREHAQLRWIGSGDLDGLDWPEPDRPILPFLRRGLDRGGDRDANERPLARPVPIVSVDWAKGMAGRAVYAAWPEGSAWRIARPAPPRDGWRLEAILGLAESIAAPFGGACLVAIDAVLGLPDRFGAQTGREGFPAALAALEASGALGRSVRSPDDWSTGSPFFAVGAGPGGLTRFIERAGGRGMLYRQIERATGGKPVFATSGIPGTVGSGSLALWRELLALRRAGGRAFRLWPFEIELEAIADARVPVLAESYPRACHGVALAERLPVPIQSIARTTRSDRMERLHALRRMPWFEAVSIEPGDLEAAAASGDEFDALLQAAAIVRLVESSTPLSSSLVDARWEGGILGTGGTVLEPPRASRRAAASTRV
jgi:8-oxo-dGTP diphosphatase